VYSLTDRFNQAITPQVFHAILEIAVRTLLRASPYEGRLTNMISFDLFPQP
jgi:hypothetical protein